MNVLEADAGSFAKPAAACCAATKALVTFMVMSRLKSASGRAKGSSGGVNVTALAVSYQGVSNINLGVWGLPL